MARKSSDLFTLLQSRGGRGGAGRGSGFLGVVTGWLQGIGGGKRRRFHDGGGGRKVHQFSGTAVAGIVFAAVGAGYLLGDAFPLAGKAALRSTGPKEPGPVKPGVIGSQGKGLDAFKLDPATECDPVSKQGYLLVRYGDGEADRLTASDLALHLRAQGVESARPYRFWYKSKGLWTVMAYFDDASAEATKQKLLASELPGVVEARKLVEGSKMDWPPAIRLQ